MAIVKEAEAGNEMGSNAQPWKWLRRKERARRMQMDPPLWCTTVGGGVRAGPGVGNLHRGPNSALTRKPRGGTRSIMPHV